MANTYSWAVNSMTCYPTYASQTNVVFQVAWVCSATDGTYNTATYGSVDVTYEAGTPFTPYNQLTLAEVNGWVAEALGSTGIAAAQAQCDEQLTALANPTSTAPPLPWGTAPAPTTSSSTQS
jgi:hypothetical protein